MIYNLKKSFKYVLFACIVTMLIGYNKVFAECNTAIFGNKNDSSTLAYWIFRGLDIIRWVAPIIVIVYGLFDLFKAMTASSEDKMKQAQSTLIKRVIISLFLFFVPTFVGLLLGAVSGDMSCYLQ